jgi:hypothetical protein
MLRIEIFVVLPCRHSEEIFLPLWEITLQMRMKEQ